MEEALTFSELRKIQKEEARSEQLTQLGDSFMLKTSDYFSQKKEIGDDREYRNAERVFEKIVSLREDKIVKAAKISAKSDKPAPENLLPFEQELYRELKKSFEHHREKADDRKSSSVETTTEEASSKEEEKETEPNEDTNDGYLTIRMTSQVPEFMGTDLESYGPFEEGEEAEVPEENAEILVNRGNAEVEE